MTTVTNQSIEKYNSKLFNGYLFKTSDNRLVTRNILTFKITCFDSSDETYKLTQCNDS